VSESGLRAHERAVAAHISRWGQPEFVARAPGRVNLIGDHTDYNDGFVLPMALPFDTAIAVSRLHDGSITEIFSEGFGEAILDPNPSELQADDWAVHIRGVFKLLREEGIDPGAWRATIATDVPTGASLSSSAALEVAMTLAILKVAETEWSSNDVARLCQRVENEVVGLPSGIMDQLISASAVAQHASLIDCRSLDIQPHRLPNDVIVAVMDTGTRRKLVESTYADRRETCARAARALGVEALRDATSGDLDRLPPSLELERRRARHVITENERTLDAADAMARNDPKTLGTLMTASHSSLRDDYEVSGPALDQIVEIALESPGCLGARMTGGGFAGCAVALVESADAEAFRAAVLAKYTAGTDEAATIWMCEPGRGASVGV
jgi:galactokinase